MLKAKLKVFYRTEVLYVWSLNLFHQQHLGTQGHTFSGPIPNLLIQKIWASGPRNPGFNKSSR